MHAYVVFAHPTRQSFSGLVLEALCRGLAEGGHTFEVGDLYGIGFRPDMTLAEYQREMNVRGDRADSPLPKDVEKEHRKISRADGMAFVFPLWWSDGPAMLKGWFDRVWVCGYAYDYGIPGEIFPFRRLAVDRALVLCSAGNTAEILEQSGVAQSMKRIYTHDRLHPGSGVGQCEVVLLPGMADPQTAPEAGGRNLDTAYRLGRDFLTAAPESLHGRTR